MLGEVGATAPDVQCVICLDMDENIGKDEHKPYELPCKHVFGRSCIAQWAKREATYPTCRGEFSTELFPGAEPKVDERQVNIVDALLSMMSDFDIRPQRGTSHDRDMGDGISIRVGALVGVGAFLVAAGGASLYAPVRAQAVTEPATVSGESRSQSYTYSDRSDRSVSSIEAGPIVMRLNNEPEQSQFIEEHRVTPAPSIEEPSDSNN